MKKNLYELRFLRLIGIFIFLFGSWSWSEAQTEFFKPMPFQELLIDYGGETVIRTEVGLQVTLLQGADMDSVVYQETHTGIKTDNNGMVSFVIGNGIPRKRIIGFDDPSRVGFQAIDFSDGPYFVKRQYDLNGGSNYTIENISQLVSVPFALHATLADSTLWAPYPWQDSLPSFGKVLITNADGTYSWDAPVIPLSGSSNEFLSTDSSGTISWIENKLPTFPSATKVLKFNQSSIYEWADEIELPIVPSGSSSKPYQALGSDGTSLSAVGVDTIASPSGTIGQILVYDADGTKQKWVDYDWALPDNFNRGDVLSVNDSGEETWIANTGIRKLSLGPDSTLGGVVFILSDDSTHALVAAFRDLNVDTILESSSLMIDTISWYEARDLVKDSSGYDEFGKEFSDWRLPTNNEFNKMIANSDIILAQDGGYWTSSQADDYKVNPMELKAIAYISEMGVLEYKTELKSKGLFVRPVRLVRYR